MSDHADLIAEAREALIAGAVRGAVGRSSC